MPQPRNTLKVDDEWQFILKYYDNDNDEENGFDLNTQPPLKTQIDIS